MVSRFSVTPLIRQEQFYSRYYGNCIVAIGVLLLLVPSRAKVFLTNSNGEKLRKKYVEIS